MNRMNEHLARVAAHHDEWSETYDDMIAGMTMYNRITHDNIRRFAPDEKGTRILDAGGGTGFWSAELAKMGYRVTLIDISEGMLGKARDNATRLGLEQLIEIRSGIIFDMPEFSDDTFAMVLCQGDPVSYCGDHHQAMKEMIRVLRTGGTLIASVDNRSAALALLRDAEIETIERFLVTGDTIIPSHLPEDQSYLIHCFTPAELRELFEEHGLTVERIIGKPVLRGLSAAKSDSPDILERLYQLEARLCDHPDFVHLGGHLEIVGRKG